MAETDHDYRRLIDLENQVRHLTQQLDLKTKGEARYHRKYAETRQKLESYETEFESALAELQAEYTGQVEALTAERDELREAFETVDTERTELAERVEALPEETATRLTEYEKQIALRDHRDAWRELMKDPELSLNPDLSPEDGWKLIGHTPEGAPDPVKLRESLAAARETSPYRAALFAAPKAEEPAPAAPPTPTAKPAGAGIARGTAGTVDPGKLTLTRADRADQKFMYENRTKINEHAAAGTLAYVD